MHLVGHYGWASGWGALEPGSRIRPKTLQVGILPVILFLIIQNTVAKYIDYIYKNFNGLGRLC